MICTEKHETEQQIQRRIDLMLREMVVEEALGAMDDDRDPGSFTQQEIADFVGVSTVTLHRIEQNALKNLQNKMVEYQRRNDG
jgi:DNA-directed RNA polymerase specialized sigma subunit